MKAISVRQPWAWLVIRPDITDPMERLSARRAGLIKDIENRVWPTRYRGDILIHASKGMTRDEYEDVQFWLMMEGLPVTLPPRDQLQRGGFVGVAELSGCAHPGSRATRWHMPAQYGFALVNSRPIGFVPWKGQLGIFDVRDDELAQEAVLQLFGGAVK